MEDSNLILETWSLRDVLNAYLVLLILFIYLFFFFSDILAGELADDVLAAMNLEEESDNEKDPGSDYDIDAYFKWIFFIFGTKTK